MISVIIPTLNEKKNIKTISKKLSKLKIVTEVIFIDDNSNDGTYDEIKKLKNKKKFKGYLRKDKKRDLSKSVFVGIKKAKKNNILVMDCDLQHDTDHIPLMWKNFNKFKCDIVVGSRFMRKNFSGNFGFLRSTISNLAILFINLFHGKKSSDPLSGFFLCKKKLIIKYKNTFYLNGYKILFDVLYNGVKHIKVYDQSIEFKKRSFEKSKFNFNIIWLFFKQMLYTKFVVKK